MKSINILLTLVLVVGAAVILTSCEAKGKAALELGASLVTVDNEGTTLLNTGILKTTSGNVTLSDGVVEWLKFMREEEKLARDLYLAFGQDYSIPVFVNIPRAEENHMNAILTLLYAYGIDDPASPEAGVFNSADLQTQYNNLLASGKTGLTDALKTGALVEEKDILDLAGVYNLDAGDDIIAVAEALMVGSRNHLRAFVRVLKINKVEYEPVALSEIDYLDIIDSGWEKGNGVCLGNQTGAGKKYSNGPGKGFRGGR